MRNLKRVLSLALAALMLMGMMVVGAGAASKDFTDASEIKNVEAVDVMVALGVLEGGDKGDFQPNSILTREQAAKIICYLLLGEEAAEKLTTNYPIFSDVPANRWSAPYISYCVNLGILAGDGAGHFYPEGKLTGVAFAKMLLVGLGYSAEREHYVGNNWEINVSAAAIATGVAPKGLVLSAELSRQDAAQMAFNTLTATMVEYLNDNTIIIGDTTVSTVGKASAVKQSPYADTMDQENLQFAEKYFGKLKKLDDTDDFDRPAHTWSFKGEEVGTYVNWDLMVEEYTASVSGKDLYNLLTATTIKNYGLTYFVDGAEDTSLVKNDLYRTNTSTVGKTGRGVLTQVFVDDNNEEITVVSINTYLAQANGNYNSKSETISLQVYNNGTGTAKIVDVDDVAAIADLKEGDFVLVNWAGDVAAASGKTIIAATDVAETMTDVTVSRFKKSTEDSSAGQSSTDRVTSITTNGEEYKNNKNAYYEDATLGDYDGSLLTDKTYDIYLDQYGYFIGAALHSGEDQYVFIAAYDTHGSAMGVRNGDALAIFTDGTMKEIEVNVKDTNTNIAAKSDSNYAQWNTAGTGVNRWFTYSVDKDNVYTLTPASRYTIEIAPAGGKTIRTDNLALSHTGGSNLGTGRSFGNDESVYIAVEDGTSVAWGNVIDEVSGRYTGVEDVKLSISANDWIVAVYDKNNYIIAAIVLGEAEGAVNNYAYILSGANSEGKDSDGNYYWTFDAIMNGELQEMTIKSKYTSTVRNLDVNTVQKLVMDSDKNVTRIDDIPNAAGTTYVKGTNEVFDNRELNAGTAVTDFNVYDVTSNKTTLFMENRTLHIDPTYDKNGLFFARDAKAVVSQSVNGSRKEVEYGSVQEAYSVLADFDNNTANGLNFYGRIVAILDSNGVAQWVFFYDNTNVTSGNRPNYNNGKLNVLNLTFDSATKTFSATVGTKEAFGTCDYTITVTQGDFVIASKTVTGAAGTGANTSFSLTTNAGSATAASGEYVVSVQITDQGTGKVLTGEATFDL